MNDGSWKIACPATSSLPGNVLTLAEGEGGRMTRRLLDETILPRLGRPGCCKLGDSAILPRVQGELAFTTDSFVVSPLFFPGGDIGTLAVYGTANDLAVAGARPKWIGVALIVEEGLQRDVLEAVLDSLARAAQRAGVSVMAGDTKVVPAGACDKLFVCTSGIGEVLPPAPPGPTALLPGDELFVSGPIGQHGTAVFAARESLDVKPVPQSDCGPLWPAVAALREAGVAVRAMRDATRGGVSAVAHEWADACQATLHLDEACLPVLPETRALCELLGLDPLHIACEGAMLVAVEPGQAERALAAWRDVCPRAAIVGRVISRGAAPVVIRRALGNDQPLDEPWGAPFPRIC